MEIVPKPPVLMATEQVTIKPEGTVHGWIYATVDTKVFGHIELRAENLDGARLLFNALGGWLQKQSPLVIANGKV